MELKAGDVAVSLRGRDVGRAYFVLEARDGRVTVHDGKREAPKSKNPKHLKAVLAPGCPVSEILSAGRTPSRRQLRGALAALRDQLGGQDAWQRMI